MTRHMQRGVTLIELMIVVVIIGVLAGIGYPSYVQHVLKANRAAAEGFMLSLANKEEQFMLDARKYFCTAGCTNVVTVSSATDSRFIVPNEVSKNYTIRVAASDTATPLTYTITAIPIPGSGQATRDTRCANLTLNQAGQKGQSGTGTQSQCW